MSTFFERINLENITEEELLRVLDKNRKAAVKVKSELKSLTKVSKSLKKETIEEPPATSKPLTKEEEAERAFEEEVDFYLNNLRNITEDNPKEQIQHLLSPTQKENYERLLLRLKLESIKSLCDFNKIIKEATNLGLKGFQFAQKEVRIEKIKLDTINSLLESLNKQDIIAEEEQKNHFIFIPSSGGNIRVLEELDSIPQEFYPSFAILFKSIKDGTFKGVKRFKSSNTKIAGISEVRDIESGARVVFDRVNADTYAIITAFVKKEMQSHGYNEQLERKIGNYKTKLPELQSDLENDEYLALQALYEEELWNKLSTSLRKQGGVEKCKKK